MRSALSESNKTRNNEKTESQLVEGCQKGDRGAQYRLYSLYKDWVFNVAFRMCNNLQEAEDITQKVFLRIFRKIEGFRGDAALSSWIYRIAVNVCINHFRKEKKRRNLFRQEAESAPQPRAGAEDEPFALKPHLERALKKLPEGYRMVFVLHDIEGYNHKEIAKIMNIADGTSKSQLHKARKELKQRLEPYLILHNQI